MANIGPYKQLTFDPHYFKRRKERKRNYLTKDLVKRIIRNANATIHCSSKWRKKEVVYFYHTKYYQYRAVIEERDNGKTGHVITAYRTKRHSN